MTLEPLPLTSNHKNLVKEEDEKYFPCNKKLSFLSGAQREGEEEESTDINSKEETKTIKVS